MGVLVKGITRKLYWGQEGRQGCGTGGGKIQMGVLVKGKTKIIWGVGGKTGVWHRRRKDTNGSTGERNNTKIIWGARGKTGVWHRRRKDTDGSTGERNNTKIIWGQEGRQGCGRGGGKIQMGVLVKGIAQKLYGGRTRGKTVAWHMGRGNAVTSSPGRFSLALEVGWVKALASASHMITKHPEFVGLLN